MPHTRRRNITLVVTGVLCTATGIAATKVSPNLLLILVPAFFLGIGILSFAAPRLDTQSLTTVQCVTLVTFAALPMVRWEPAPFELMCIALTALLLISNDPHQIEQPFVLICILFICVQMVTVTRVLNVSESFMHSLITALMVTICATSYLIATRWTTLRPALTGYAWGAIVTTSVGLLLYTGKVATPLHAVTQLDLRLRVFFKDPNVFATFLYFPIFILIDSLFHQTQLTTLGSRGTRFAGLIALLAGLFFAYSRAAWGGFAIGCIFYFAIRMQLSLKFFLKYVFLSFVVLLICLSLLKLLPSSQIQFLQERARIQTYDTSRFDAQRQSIDTFTDNLFLGHGPLSAKFEIGLLPHNMYLQALYESGLIGASLLFIILSVAVLRSFRASHTSRNSASSRFGQIVTAALLSTLASSLFIDSTHWRHLWVTVGFAWALPFLKLDEKHETRN